MVQTALQREDPQLLQRAFETNLELVFKMRPYPALHLEVRGLGSNRKRLEDLIANELGDEWNGLNQMCVAYLWMLESADPNIIRFTRPGYQEQTRLFYERMREFMV